jgi:hypothetical protein
MAELALMSKRSAASRRDNPSIATGFDHAFPQVTRIDFGTPQQSRNPMHKHSLIRNPLGIPPIQIGRNHL